jgi:hypothetical protein
VEIRNVSPAAKMCSAKFGGAGLHMLPPAATTFAWANPHGFLDSDRYNPRSFLFRNATRLLVEDDFVRIAVVENEHRIRRDARNINQFSYRLSKGSKLWLRLDGPD